MGVIKSVKKQNLELRRENARLRNDLSKQHEMLEFLGILNDVDVEELMTEETREDVDNG